MTTAIKKAWEVAGVECPKQTGKMHQGDDCHKCEHFKVCMEAADKQTDQLLNEIRQDRDKYQGDEYIRNTAAAIWDLLNSTAKTYDEIYSIIGTLLSHAIFEQTYTGLMRKISAQSIPVSPEQAMEFLGRLKYGPTGVSPTG